MSQLSLKLSIKIVFNGKTDWVRFMQYSFMRTNINRYTHEKSKEPCNATGCID